MKTGGRPMAINQSKRADRRVLAVDVGGSHVKIRASTGEEVRKVESGPRMTGTDMVNAVRDLATGLDHDVVAIG